MSMRDYDALLNHAKRAVTEAIADLARDKPRLTIQDLATRIDDLNRAWDELTDALVRQRATLGETIDDLHRRLAEAKRR